MKISALEVILFLSCTLSVFCEQNDDPLFEVKSKRAFHDTPYGQIHYKYGGDFGSVDDSSVYTFLLFHGNPRSSDEFTELVCELASRFRNQSVKFSYIAMDMLGEGSSDDSAVVSDHEYVSIEQYTQFMIEIASKVFEMTQVSAPRCIVPVGSLTGSAIATELSYKLILQNGINSLCKVGNCKVLTTVLHDPMYYFSDQIVTNVHLYADQQRKWQPEANGKHLLEIWNDTNYQPYRDLALQDRKSLDRFRAAKTQWQVILSYADYSSQSLLGRLIALSKVELSPRAVNSNEGSIIPPLIIVYGGEFLNDPMMNKFFEVQKMRGIIADATKGGLYEKVIDGGNQALLSQNVTLIADMIMEQIVKPQ